MKMVKSLLLVSAAGFVAVSGAQAADLPVKAKPVEYVKVCSLYGAGFYYIPGTDICMKVGGFVRYQVNYHAGTSLAAGPFSGTGGFNNRIQMPEVVQRARAVATFDTRQQTAYGTLRTYLLIGFTHDSNSVNPSPSPAVYMTRGFIQIAGFTFGKATSFFDFANNAAVAYNAGYTHVSSTGDTGQLVGAYTAQFGNGLSATVGIEQSRRLPTTYAPGTTATGVGVVGGLPAVVTTTTPGFVLGSAPTPDNLGGLGASGLSGMPDIVANIRVDQAWGSAQIAGALHDVSAAYYGTTGFFETNGHPGNKWGFAVSGGLRLNAPMIGPGDYFQTQVTYAQGAGKYASYTPVTTGTLQYWTGSSFGFGFLEDAVFGAGTDINLTTAWSVFASYEHFWTPSLRTSLYGSYLAVSRNATGNGLICAALFGPNGSVTSGATSCDMNFQAWNIGSRTQWNVTKDFYVGVDVIYQKLNSASLNGGAPVTLRAIPAGGKSGNVYNTADQDVVSVTWRAHRDIVP